jgi:hypothetical protein
MRLNDLFRVRLSFPTYVAVLARAAADVAPEY